MVIKHYPETDTYGCTMYVEEVEFTGEFLRKHCKEI